MQVLVTVQLPDTSTKALGVEGGVEGGGVKGGAVWGSGGAAWVCGAWVCGLWLCDDG